MESMIKKCSKKESKHFSQFSEPNWRNMYNFNREAQTFNAKMQLNPWIIIINNFHLLAIMCIRKSLPLDVCWGCSPCNLKPPSKELKLSRPQHVYWSEKSASLHTFDESDCYNNNCCFDTMWTVRGRWKFLPYFFLTLFFKQWDGVSVPVQAKTKKWTENFHPACIFALALRIENSFKKIMSFTRSAKLWMKF